MHRAFTINNFIAVINYVKHKASALSQVSHFQPSLMSAGKARVYPSEALTGLHSKSRILALLANITLVWKRLTVRNTLAFLR